MLDLFFWQTKLPFRYADIRVCCSINTWQNNLSLGPRGSMLTSPTQMSFCIRHIKLSLAKRLDRSRKNSFDRHAILRQDEDKRVTASSPPETRPTSNNVDAEHPQ